MIGKATAFSITDNDPVTIFGLPKTVDLEARVQFGYLTLANVTTQFRILSQPCSVIRDVTLQTAELMQNAQGKSSRDTRSVLSMSFLSLCFLFMSSSIVTSWPCRMRKKFPHAPNGQALYSHWLDRHLHPSRCAHSTPPPAFNSGQCLTLTSY